MDHLNTPTRPQAVSRRSPTRSGAGRGLLTWAVAFCGLQAGLWLVTTDLPQCHDLAEVVATSMVAALLITPMLLLVLEWLDRRPARRRGFR